MFQDGHERKGATILRLKFLEQFAADGGLIDFGRARGFLFGHLHLCLQRFQPEVARLESGVLAGGHDRINFQVRPACHILLAVRRSRRNHSVTRIIELWNLISKVNMLAARMRCSPRSSRRGRLRG
jgi:hypothetical protein